MIEAGQRVRLSGTITSVVHREGDEYNVTIALATGGQVTVPSGALERARAPKVAEQVTEAVVDSVGETEAGTSETGGGEA